MGLEYTLMGLEYHSEGWSGGAMLLGKFRYRGVLVIWIIVGHGPTVLVVGAGGGCLDIFSLIYHFFFLSPSLWETAQYRLKYCLKGPKQPTNQPTKYHSAYDIFWTFVIIGLIVCKFKKCSDATLL